MKNTLKDMYKIRLIKNSKKPTKDWKGKKIENFTKDKVYFNHYNYACVTGKINDITVIDFDSYKLDYLTLNEHPLYKEFENLKNEAFNTFTVKTPSGGYHFYYKYEKEVKTIASEIEVDIRNDGAYITSPGSCINNKYYKVINDAPIKRMSKQLKDFLLNNLYNNTSTNSKDGIITNNNLYVYDFGDEDKEKILTNLPNEYYTKFDYWFKFTTVCKQLDCFELWDKINKQYPGYDYDKNLSHWNSINKHNFLPIIEELFIKLGYDTNAINYVKFAPIIQNTIKYNEVINKQKLGYDFIKPYLETPLDPILLNKVSSNCLLIKSDTGTGKTTSFKHFIKEEDYNFISIVSRITLGDEQYEVFNKFGIDCNHYQLTDRFVNNKNYIICLDSIMKLTDLDFSNYIIFLDEVSSIIEYLHDSDTMNHSRIIIYYQLIKIINESKMIIGTDADINDITNSFFNYTNKKPYIINNTYKHNKGIETEEIYSFNEFIDNLKKLDKYMVCSDSKSSCEEIYKALNDDTVKIITSETNEYVNLDKYEKIIFSPKIIYGLDSSMERDVYVYYKEHTINPKHMVQQICRCRNIKKLYYYFNKKQFKDIKYSSFQELKDDILNLNKYGVKNFKLIGNDIIMNQYLEIISKIEYNKEAYKTNKYAHFLRLIIDRGFIVNSIVKKNIKGQEKDIKKELKEEKLKNFNIEDHRDFNDKYLHFDDDTIIENKELFLDQNKMTKHFNISDYFFRTKEDVKDKFNNLDDFIIKKIYNNKSRILFLHELKEKVNCPKEDIKIIKSLDKPEYYEKIYKLMFRDRSKNIDFKNNDTLLKIIKGIHTKLFGSILNVKRKTINKKTTHIYTIDNDIIEHHKKLYMFRYNYNHSHNFDF